MLPRPTWCSSSMQSHSVSHALLLSRMGLGAAVAVVALVALGGVGPASAGLLDWGRSDRPALEVNIPWLPCEYTFRSHLVAHSVPAQRAEANDSRNWSHRSPAPPNPGLCVDGCQRRPAPIGAAISTPPCNKVRSPSRAMLLTVMRHELRGFTKMSDIVEWRPRSDPGDADRPAARLTGIKFEAGLAGWD